MTMFANLFQRRALAEAGNVGVLARILISSPGVVGIRYAGDVLR